MENHTKETIISMIDQALRERDAALSPENRDLKGYPFAAGYCSQCLKTIRNIVEVA